MGQRILYVSTELLVEMFRRDDRLGRPCRFEGMPADARIVNVSDQVRLHWAQIAFLIESAEFPETPAGNQIPELRLVCHEVRGPAGGVFRSSAGEPFSPQPDLGGLLMPVPGPLPEVNFPREDLPAPDADLFLASLVADARAALLSPSPGGELIVPPLGADAVQPDAVVEG